MRLRWGPVAVMAVVAATFAGPAGPVLAREEPPALESGEFRLHHDRGWSFALDKICWDTESECDLILRTHGRGETVTFEAPGGITTLAAVVPVDDEAPSALHLVRAVRAVDPAKLTLTPSADCDVHTPESDVFVFRTQKGGWVRAVVVDRAERGHWWLRPITVRYVHNRRGPWFDEVSKDAKLVGGLWLEPAAIPWPCIGRFGNTGWTLPPGPCLDALDDARIRWRRGEFLEAAGRFGDAIAIAHASGDLVAEDEAAGGLERLVDRNGMSDLAAGDDDAIRRRSVRTASFLARAMSRLDPEHRGAFVSALVLSRNLLQLATETGDPLHVHAAAKGAEIHRLRPSAGRAAVTTAKYAEGMRCAAEDRFAAATAPLRAAFDEAAAAGWRELATHAGTELAVAWWRAGDENAALDALGDVRDLLTPLRPTFLWDWERYAARRLADAPEPLRRLGRRAPRPRDRYTPSGSGYGGAAGDGGAGRGGRGGDGESGSAATDPDPRRSVVGELVPRLGSRSALVEVRRRAGVFDLRWATAWDERITASLVIDGQVRSADDRCGVTVGFHDASVALRMLDCRGGRAQPGERFPCDPVRAFYLLAADETWRATAGGSVSIESR